MVQDAWEQQSMLAEHFRREVSSALLVPTNANLDDIVEALEWRRLRLYEDAQIVEWVGAAERVLNDA
jgi:hypothetical protein